MTPISDDEKREVIGEYLAGNSINTISMRRGLAWATVKKIIERHKDEIEGLKADQRRELVTSSLNVAHAYLQKLGDPATIKAAKGRDAAIIYGVLIDKWQKEQELAMKADEVYKNALDFLTVAMREELAERPDIIEPLTAFMDEQKERLLEAARLKNEQHKGALKKGRPVARKQIRSTDGQSLKIDGASHDRDSVIAALAKADPEMQLSIIEQWERTAGMSGADDPAGACEERN